MSSDDATPETVIAELEKNARETIRVTLGVYGGTRTLSVWRWYRTASGDLRPGKGGLVVGLRHLPALAEALASALATARTNGLLPPR